MSLASSHTDHILGPVAGAQKDYSQSLELPKRPSTAEWQEWFPGSREDTSARTAMASAVGHVCQDSNGLGRGTCLVIPIQPWALAVQIPGCQEDRQVPSHGQSGRDNIVSLLKTVTTYASARDHPNYVSQWTLLQHHRSHFQLKWHSEAVAFPLHIRLGALLLPESSDFSCPMQSLHFHILTALGWSVVTVSPVV